MSRIVLLFVLGLIVYAVLHYGYVLVYVPMRFVVPAVIIAWIVHRVTR